MFIRKKKHDAAMKAIARLVVDRDDTIMIREAAIRRLERENSWLRSDVRAAEMAYEESRKAHRRVAEELAAARAEAEANKVDAEELVQWRKYGQMRDPATGCLIPRVKAEVA